MKGKPYRGEVAEPGESIWARRPGPNLAKFDSPWYPAVWLGKTETSDEHLVADTKATRAVRTIRRRPEAERWDVEAFQTFAGAPWDLKLKPSAGAQPNFEDQPRVEPSQRATRPPADPVVAASAAAAAVPTVRPAAVEPAVAEGGAPSVRHYITAKLIEQYGKTPNCPRCDGQAVAHSPECRQRVEGLQLQQQLAQPSPTTAAAASTPAAGSPAPLDVPMRAVGSSQASAPADVDMAEPSSESPSKRSRPTIAGLEANVLVEAHV